jgi:urease gamma subunit
MSMPKGHKSNNGYATVVTEYGGMDYRTIAEKMNAAGYKMNHATARNVFLRAMQKIAKPVCEINEVYDSSSIVRTSRDPRFQEGITEIIKDIYDEGISI